MKIKIEIDTENDAFQEGHSGIEVQRILRGISNRIGVTGIDTEFALQDLNGHTVGRYSTEEQDGTG